MLWKPLQCILSLLVLLGVVHTATPPTAECTAQAWVRAPDLTPNAIVSGDVRVKISAGCPSIRTVLLGLRLKERSFVKAIRSPEDRKLMRSARLTCIDHMEASPWTSPSLRFANRSDLIAFHEMLANKDVWMVREEERIVFETTQTIHRLESASEDRDVVQNFAILVPSTNFPPALDYEHSALMLGGDWNDGSEIVDVESIYEYFLRVAFANGTTQDISAGFTGFQPLYDSAETPPKPTSETLELKFSYCGHLEKDSPTAYTARISSASGLIFTEGSENPSVTVVISRTGPARTFTAPLTILACVEPTFSSKWAAEYDVAHSTPRHRPAYVLRSALDNVDQGKRLRPRLPCIFDPEAGISITLPNSTSDEIEAHEIVTTSDVVMIPVKVDRRLVTNFETYYQTFSNALHITLETRSDEVVNPDYPSAEPPSAWGQEFEDDEEEWVPWEKQTQVFPKVWRLYSGTVPVIVRPVDEVMPPRQCGHASMDMLGQVVLSDEAVCNSERTPLSHYLDAGARGPIFVDNSAVQGLLSEYPAERERRAPILEPVVSSPPEGEERVIRYYSRVNPGISRIYVGETWARKVANKKDSPS